MTSRTLNASEWLLGILVTLLATIAWYQSSVSSANDITIYTIFPLLGLIAFGLMWTHFVYGAIRRFTNTNETSHTLYMDISMGIVLALIVLHPGLLWLGLYQDGLGLPPSSSYAAYPMNMFAISLGSLGLAIFLAYELKRKFEQRSWWKYVEYAQIAAIFAIFVHALSLGGALSLAWYQGIWWLYGIILVSAITYTLLYDAHKIKGRII